MTEHTHNGSTFTTVFGDEDEVHPVLIAGAGPAGTLLAFCLARLGVRPLIVDSNNLIDHEWGRGDALLCRTLEVLRSLGLGETIIANGFVTWERTFWNMNSDPPACTTLANLFPAELDTEDLFSLAIRQGLVEKILSDGTEAMCGVKVLRPWSVIDTHLDDTNPETEPVTVTLQSQYGELRKVRARRVVGCDGGHSSVRRSLQKYGVRLEGDAHDSVWSAIDVVGFQTDFPDTKKLTIIASKHGSIRLIPREDINGQNCMRIYCELNREGTPSLADVSATIHKVLHPFKFTWDSVNWFTVYTVAQRIASEFDVNERVFLAGDAAHIHSPKAALGMNTSLMDAHNLALKLALVEKGVAKSSILSTYALERRRVAAQLMTMDAELIRVYASHGKSADPADHEKLISFQRAHFSFQTGTSITYPECLLVDSVPHTPSAMLALVGGEGLRAGRRLLPATVRRYSDGQPTKILDAIPFDGRFTIFICLGDITQPGAVERFEGLRDMIYRPGGLWERLETRRSASSVLRFIGVTTASHVSTTLSAIVHHRINIRGPTGPELSKRTLFVTASLYIDNIPSLSPYQLQTESSPRTPANADILARKAAAGILLHPLYQKWDVDPQHGGIVVVRPDGHVGTLQRGLEVREAWTAVEAYFKRFLVL
ncbi:FAD binding domain-containing protein [Mycena crocata]|nr:FAD binding domain-containing protein [Mycena crocata]